MFKFNYHVNKYQTTGTHSETHNVVDGDKLYESQ